MQHSQQRTRRLTEVSGDQASAVVSRGDRGRERASRHNHTHTCRETGEERAFRRRKKEIGEEEEKRNLQHSQGHTAGTHQADFELQARQSRRSSLLVPEQHTTQIA